MKIGTGTSIISMETDIMFDKPDAFSRKSIQNFRIILSPCSFNIWMVN